VKCLVTSFNHGVRLWITTGNNLPFNTMFIFESFADFSSEFFSFVHSFFCRPWISGEPTEFQPVGYYVGGLFTDLCYFKESCCRIYHSHAMKLNVCFGLLGSPDLHGPTRSTHSVCQGMISGLGLGGSRHFFWSRFFLTAQFSQRLHTRIHVHLSPIHAQCCAMVSSSLCSPGCINVK